VPLEDLAERFERVYLVDIFHMPHVRRKARRYPNVKFLTGDVTGIFAMLKEHKTPGGRTPAPPPLIPHLADADLIVSCSCLSQLAGPFNDLFRRRRGFSDDDCDQLSRQVMEQHINAIALQAKGIGVIITDTERFAVQGDHTVSRLDLLQGLKLPPTQHQQYDEDWDWNIAPAPEEHRSHNIVHAVSARIYERDVAAEEQAAETQADEGELPQEDGLADEVLPQA